MDNSPATIVAFPNFIAGMTGIAYARIGIRKVWVALINGAGTYSLPRKALPETLPPGNELAFSLARLITDAPKLSRR